MADPKVVLVVEDNRQNLELVEYLLEEVGLEVHTAGDAEEARDEVRRSLPDLILMDMQLPGTDGLTLAGELRQRPDVAEVQRFLAAGRSAARRTQGNE